MVLINVIEDMSMPDFYYPLLFGHSPGRNQTGDNGRGFSLL
jgi:hypothetical protein